MKRKTLYIIISIIGLGIVGAAIGIYLYQKPVKNFAESEAEITISAKDLFNAFVKDQNKANAEYVSENKTIQIKGKIIEININADNTTNVLLDVSDPEGDVSCSVVKEDIGKAKKYKSGDSITIKGQCTGYQELINKEVIMIRCGIVE